MGTTVNVMVFDRLKGEKRVRLCINGLSVDVDVNLWTCFLESNKVKIHSEYCVFQTLPLSEAICLGLK